MIHILIVEDEKPISNLIRMSLTKAGYSCMCAYDGEQALDMIKNYVFDLILLDVMIPKIDGFGVCEVIKKQSDVPVMFLSALSDDASQIKGYDLMADDYMTKPFSMPILLRKVSALLRRNNSSSVRRDNVITCGDIVMDTDTMEVRVDGRPVELTSREFDLLLTLAKNPGRVYTREILLDLLWDYDSLVDERIVDSHIKNLRHKMGTDHIETVRGRGYRIGKKAP